MKKLIAAIVMAAAITGITGAAYASDWDKAGKTFAILEGVRVLSRGNIDLIGTLTGINRPERERHVEYVRYEEPRYRHGRHRPCRHERVWVPDYEIRRVYVPATREYRPGRGYVFVEAHYEEHQVECGGHWERRCGHRDCD